MIDIGELIKETHDRAIRKGWYEEGKDGPRTWVHHLLLIHSEVSEATESCRNGEEALWFTESGKPEGLAAELADVVIRICDCAGHLGLPLEEAIRVKSDYNETRPVRHGGKVI